MRTGTTLANQPQMNKKTRWLVTAAAALFLTCGVLAEVSDGGLTNTLNSLGASPIAALLGAGNALAIIP